MAATGPVQHSSRLRTRFNWGRESVLDLHCHLLPSIDDGAVDLEMSLEMARMAVADGIHTVA